MGSTETTLYTIAIYVGAVKIKNTRFVLICALLADLVRYVNFCLFLSGFVERFLLTFFKLCIIMFIEFIYSIFLI